MHTCSIHGIQGNDLLSKMSKLINARYRLSRKCVLLSNLTYMTATVRATKAAIRALSSIVLLMAKSLIRR